MSSIHNLSVGLANLESSKIGRKFVSVFNLGVYATNVKPPIFEATMAFLERMTRPHSANEAYKRLMSAKPEMYPKVTRIVAK